MPLSRSFKDYVQQRVRRDPAFARALFQEAIAAMLQGDIDTGRAVLRDYINSTVGFEKLAEATGTPTKSLMRMFGPRGNPQANNLFSVISYLQKQGRLNLQVSVKP
jgi:DNA-binding phage protein